MHRLSLLLLSTVFSLGINAQVLLGDMDHDGKLTISDITYLIECYLDGTPQTTNISVNSSAIDNSVLVGNWYATNYGIWDISPDGILTENGTNKYSCTFHPLVDEFKIKKGEFPSCYTYVRKDGDNVVLRESYYHYFKLRPVDPEYADAEYALVDYISSQGKDWFLTDYVDKENSSYYIEYTQWDIPSDQTIFSAGYNFLRQGIKVGCEYGDKCLTTYVNADKSTTTLPLVEDMKYTFHVSHKKAEMTNQEGTSTYNFNSTYTHLDEPLTIFCQRDYYGAPLAIANGKLHCFKVFEDDQLIYDYRPAFRLTDAVVGLFDMVNHKFLENKERDFDFGEIVSYLNPDNGNACAYGSIPMNVNGVELNLKKVKGGTYTMGATAEQIASGYKVNNDEKPTHDVILSDYYISETVVTQELWNAVMGDESYPTWTSDKGWGDKYPVYGKTFEECETFIERLNTLTGKHFSIPTEAQWEYAARGGNKSCGYVFAGSNNVNSVGWIRTNSNMKLHPVAAKEPNELGLYDMSGNVWEYCRDNYSSYYDYDYVEKDPCKRFDGTPRVLRGGSYDTDANLSRVSYRMSTIEGFDYLEFMPIGFRIVMEK